LIIRSENTTDCTEHSPWEAKSNTVSQQHSCLSENPKVFYHIHKNLPLHPIKTHKNAVHILTNTHVTFTLILSYKLCPISHKSSLTLPISCLQLVTN